MGDLTALYVPCLAADVVKTTLEASHIFDVPKHPTAQLHFLQA